VSRILASSGDPAVAARLRSHPFVELTEGGPAQGVAFRQGEWSRQVLVGRTDEEQRGILEIMDNNPLVCADSMSVPSAVATLALVALGPLASGGLIAESPTIIASAPLEEAEIDALMEPLGWLGGSYVHVEPQDLGSVVAATVMVAIHTPAELDDVDALYEERYGRTFFVRRDEDSEWDVGLVAGRPYALYRLRIAPDEPTSLLTVRAIADRDGKGGAAQVVHAMNVMAGFEESLGIV
jgi:N-acetyl-gamma-glutamylphosphate reductase